MQLESPNEYINNLNMKLQLNKGIIKIKKKYTYEKNFRSKVLMIYAIEDEAKEIDE